MISDHKKAKSKQQIAEEYGICVKTLNKWLKKVNLKIDRGLISPKVQQIHNKFDSLKNS